MLRAAVMALGLADMALAQGTLRIAMTSGDVPQPNGQTDQGAKGMRFLGYQVFKALIAHDLILSDKPVTLIPGQASEWPVIPDHPTQLTYRLREGVNSTMGRI